MGIPMILHELMLEPPLSDFFMPHGVLHGGCGMFAHGSCYAANWFSIIFLFLFLFLGAI